MAFADESAQAVRALENEQSGDDAFPRTAERFRRTRARLGLTEAQVAERWGLEPSLYWDLEISNSEVFMCVSLSELPRLAAALEVPLLVLLFGGEPENPVVPLSYGEVARHIQERSVRDGMSLGQLSEVAGWELEPIVQDAEALGTYNLSGVYDICKIAGVDWLRVLAEAARKGP